MTNGQRTVTTLLAVAAVLLGLNLISRPTPALGQPEEPQTLLLTSQPPVGTVVAWLKSLPGAPTMPANWVECNGQVLDDPGSPFDSQLIPDLNGTGGPPRFLRGAVASGATGGTEVHNHQWHDPGAQLGITRIRTVCDGTPCAKAGTYDANGQLRSIGNSGATLGIAAFTSNAGTRPSYYEVVWIMKVRPTAEGACFADLDGDGFVAVPDLLKLLAAWGPCL